MSTIDAMPSLEDMGFPPSTTDEVPSPRLESPTSPQDPLSMTSLTNPEPVNWDMPDFFPNNYAPQHDYQGVSGYFHGESKRQLHHVSSTVSLHSIAPQPNAVNTLHVHTQPDYRSCHSSRHSSISSLSGLSPPMELYGSLDKIQPRLEVQTQGLRMGRQRSSSRVAPYSRHERSASLSGQSEAEDDVTSLLSASSAYHTPLSSVGTSLANGISNGMNKMTLHHRRSASNVSFPHTTPMLARKHRSTSLLTPRREELRGTAIERSNMVRRLLSAAADEMRSLPSASQQDKAKSAWVKKWLQLSYTLSAGHTVPRQGLYASYVASSDYYGVRAINSASFGKAVRNAFPGIKTRRLGVRGNSKYHYIAIRPAVSIEAERLNRFGDSSGQWHVAAADGSMGFRPTDAEVEMDEFEDSDGEGEDDDDFFSRSLSSGSIASLAEPARPAFLRRHTTSSISSPLTTAPLHPTPVYDLPGFPVLSPMLALGPGFPQDQTQPFWNAFCRHQELLIASLRSQQFDRFELNSRNFWIPLSQSWLQVCHHPIISKMVSDAMSSTYNHAVSVLLEKIYTPMPAQTHAALLHLAEHLESLMEECFAGFSRDFGETKVELSVRAAHLLHRCVDLQQLSGALQPILTDREQLANMLTAWDRLDIAQLSDQCALSCGCHQHIIETMLIEFREWLEHAVATPQHSPSLLQLSEWVDRIMGDLKMGLHGLPPISMSSLITKAGFVTSQVMRDFTLKSEATFGLFQLIKTFIDDWISISSLRLSALSVASAESTTMGSMSVLIPSQDPLLLAEDLSTAVPYPYVQEA